MRTERSYEVEASVGAEGVAPLPPFDSIELDLADLFAPLPPSGGAR